jgi:hypothetical protein
MTHAQETGGTAGPPSDHQALRGSARRRSGYGRRVALGLVCLGVLCCVARLALPQAELRLSLRSSAGTCTEGDPVTLTVVLSSTGVRHVEVYEDISQNISIRGLSSTGPFVLTQRHGPKKRLRVAPDAPAEFRVPGHIRTAGHDGHAVVDFGMFGTSRVEPPARVLLVARFFPCKGQGSGGVYSEQIKIEVQAKPLLQR